MTEKKIRIAIHVKQEQSYFYTLVIVDTKLCNSKTKLKRHHPNMCVQTISISHILDNYIFKSDLENINIKSKMLNSESF